ncbi:hypothetical protein LTR84_010758 [Exophiala bonariae]|uniref:Rhamnolipids biosynthesis 3-oxoacyl-[acyl-carrier-protein] reductase n=1 Tax=Exophiala bonariae TaxID=1690606 RepID=A0AAV9MS82_9EURO|nr:hypothetical protein LTR84_010758 [Exophiala bonariae]
MGTAKSDVQLKSFSSIFRLDGKVALVTGGSRGIGLHVASGFLQAGCIKVYITARKAKGCDEAVAALNSLPNKLPHARAISVPADSSSVVGIERLVVEIGKTTDHVDILFANAGATWGERFETHPEVAFSKLMDINVKGVFYTVQKLEPLLKRSATVDNPSRVIVNASIAGLGVGELGEHATYSYAASKAAVIHLTKNMAVELAPRGILCNVVAPGFYPTRMASGLIELSGGVGTLAASTPNRRVGAPEDIAALVTFLAAPASKHLNGIVIVTDGGAMLGRSKL